VVLRDEDGGEVQSALVHLEELDGENIELDHLPFRFAYCLTAHTAQGGEWDTVYISKPDLVSYAGFCWHTKRLDDLARWAYTGITRAKTRLVLLAAHRFVTVEEAAA
jgi:superfamily I DNA/RNA helicase